MRTNKPLSRVELDAIQKMSEVLGFEGTRTEILESAAAGLVWRNERLSRPDIQLCLMTEFKPGETARAKLRRDSGLSPRK